MTKKDCQLIADKNLTNFRRPILRLTTRASIQPLQGVAVPEWIRVTDRLPEQGPWVGPVSRDVLVFVPDDDGGNIYMGAYNLDDCTWRDGQNDEIYNVTHWHELPDQPAL